MIEPGPNEIAAKDLTDDPALLNMAAQLDQLMVEKAAHQNPTATVVTSVWAEGVELCRAIQILTPMAPDETFESDDRWKFVNEYMRNEGTGMVVYRTETLVRRYRVG